jgi:hypothetical protein
MDVNHLGENVPQGISIRNGPVTKMELDGSGANGNTSRRNTKRRGRTPAVKEGNDSDSDTPLVSTPNDFN